MTKEITFENMKKILAETAKIMAENAKNSTKSFNESNKRLDRIEKMGAETMKGLEENRKSLEENRKNLEETNKGMKMQSSYIDNQSRVLEEKFMKSFYKTDHLLNGIQFDFVSYQPSFKKGNEQAIPDMILLNGIYVAVVEVKSNLHVNDVEKMKNKTLPIVESHVPYKDKKFIGMLCAEGIKENARQKALEYGYWVISFSGVDLVIETSQKQLLNK